MKYRNVLRAWAISAISQSFAREMLISGEGNALTLFQCIPDNVGVVDGAVVVVSEPLIKNK